MAKFPFRKPRIISKKFPRVDSSIDSVTKSLDELVFSYSNQIDSALQKKHLMMAFSSLALLLVLGSFISPKGKAESSVFYPSTCLGGWVNPQYAEGELETLSNSDESQFTKSNSAVLPKNTNGEMYCGNFSGKIDTGTRPTKIIVSLALTKGADLLLEDRIESGSFASSSLQILDTAYATQVSFTLASSSVLVSTSSEEQGSDQTKGSTSSKEGEVPSLPVVSPSVNNVKTTSVLEGVVTSLQDTITTVTSLFTTGLSNTDTVVVPKVTPEQTASPQDKNEDQGGVPSSGGEGVRIQEQPPTSFFPVMLEKYMTFSFIDRVFAEEAPKEVLVTDKEAVLASSSLSATDTASLPAYVATTLLNEEVSSSSLLLGDGVASSSLLEKGEESTTTGKETVLVTEDNQFQNNFLEVLYTFDGITWISLGDLNEISMKYRTFEIPVTQTTSWGSLKRLQIKIQSKKRIDENPTVYLDGIRVDVLYETAMPHDHPDFVRDTILKDKSDDGVHVVNVINSDTGNEEIWYTTVSSQEGYGVAPGTWVQVNQDEVSQNVKLVDIYGQHVFWIDEKEKILWVTDLQKMTNDGVGINENTTTRVVMMASTSIEVSTTTGKGASTTMIAVPVITVATTTAPFIKANGEEWVLDYNEGTKASVIRMK